MAKRVELTGRLIVEFTPEQKRDALRECGRILAPMIMQALEKIRAEKEAKKSNKKAA